MTRGAHRYAILLALALACSAGCSRRQAPGQAEAKPTPTADANMVQLSPAEQKNAGITDFVLELRRLPVELSASGRITLDENRTWRVGAVTDGRIAQVLANVGDRVHSGQVVGRMHSHEVHEARAMYQKALADLDRARVDAAFARKVRDRSQRLYALKAASQEQVEQSQTELKNAQVAWANAQTEVTRAHAHLVEFLGVPADPRPGEAGVELIPIRTPAAGVVLARDITPGMVVQPGSQLFVISNLVTVWMIAAVNEANLAKLQVGMPAQVSVQEAYGKLEFPGRIGSLGEQLDPATRTMQVRIVLPNPQEKLKPEMYATVRIKLGWTPAGLYVPQEALQDVEGRTVVFVRTGSDRFEARTVTTGAVRNGMAEVVTGLRAGDRVVGQGSFLLKSQLLKATMSGSGE